MNKLWWKRNMDIVFTILFFIFASTYAGTYVFTKDRIDLVLSHMEMIMAFLWLILCKLDRKDDSDGN